MWPLTSWRSNMAFPMTRPMKRKYMRWSSQDISAWGGCKRRWVACRRIGTKRKSRKETKTVSKVEARTKLTAGRIDLQTHLIGCARLPQPHIRIENLLRHELEPFPRQSTRVDSHLPYEFEPPNFPQILATQTHDRLHAVAEQKFSSHVHSHVPLVPLHAKLRTRVLKPLYLVLVALHLRRGYVGIADEVLPVGALDFGVHHPLVGRDE